MESIMKKIEKASKALSGDVSINTLFPADFVQRHSSFSDIQALLTPAQIVDQSSYDTWTNGEPDEYIKNSTDFSSWGEMFTTAAKEFARRKQEMLRNGTWVEETFDSASSFYNICIHINFNVA